MNNKLNEPIKPGQVNREAPAQHPKAMTRRHFLKVAGGVFLGGAAVSALNACTPGSASSSLATPAIASPPAATETSMAAMTMPATTPSTPAPASNAVHVVVDGTLVVPPLLMPQAQNGTKVFNLTLQKGQPQFLAGQTTSTYGINGNYLGPTLRATQGDTVLINVSNHIGEDSTLHWHGMHLPATMDGGPHQAISDNSTWAPHFTIMQPAATLWYHPHMLSQTLRQVGMGQAGIFILDDAGSVQSSLPHTYGVDDVPLLFQDQTIGANGELVFNNGGRGQNITQTNGSISPTHQYGPIPSAFAYVKCLQRELLQYRVCQR